MGRLIDTDAIKWDKCEDADGNPVYVLDKRDIDKQPTAYDVDAVVEQLENERKFWENAYDRDIGKEKARSYVHAIEIVRGGGVNEIN
jgi:hypothetical protein